jgi:hypothetical protein
VLVSKIFCIVHQYGKYSIHVGCALVRTRDTIEDSVGRFTIYLMAKGAIVSPVKICAQEGKVIMH